MRTSHSKAERKLRLELERVHARLIESEATTAAIRSGNVDTIFTAGPNGSQVFSLQDPEDPYRVLAERMNEGAATLSADGTILFCNPRLAEMVDLPSEQVLGSSFSSMLREEQQNHLQELLQSAVKDDIRSEAELLRKDGTSLPVQLSLSLVSFGELEKVFCLVATDLSELNRAKRGLREQSEIFEQAQDAILIRDLNSRIQSWNRGARDLYGWSGEEALGRVSLELLHTVFPEPLDAIIAVLQERREWEGELKHIRRDGKAIVVASRWSLLRDERGDPAAILEIDRDITARVEAEAELNKSEERLRFLAYHDALTALPNRALFQDRLAQTLSDARRRKEQVALLFIDLDHFKDINDSLGHSAGDIVLQQVAERLRKCARSNDTVARLGGDEFVVIASAIEDSSHAVIVADRIKTEFAADFMVKETPLSVSCSVGISVFPVDGTDAETLLKNADTALFSAKDGGRKGWRFFTPKMNGKVLERLRMETALRQAVEKGQLFLEYQPQLEFSTGRIVGAEALLRWRHPEMGLLLPNTFIPVAENIGEIIPIGAWVLRTACTQARQWQEEGFPPLVMAANVSAVQLRQGSLPTTIKWILGETGLAPEYLELEITESLLLTPDDDISSQMVSLEKMGLRLALDDFGTGYSSFSYLRSFRFDKLKIDGSFMQNIDVDSNDAQITAAIISMGKFLNMKVIAECIETKEQMDFLRSHGCDQVQGFLFSRPLSASAFAEKLRSIYGSQPVLC